MAGKTELRFIKGELYFTSMMLSVETTFSVDERRVIDALYLEFKKALDMFTPAFL